MCDCTDKEICDVCAGCERSVNFTPVVEEERTERDYQDDTDALIDALVYMRYYGPLKEFNEQLGRLVNAQERLTKTIRCGNYAIEPDAEAEMTQEDIWEAVEHEREAEMYAAEYMAENGHFYE